MSLLLFLSFVLTVIGLVSLIKLFTDIRYRNYLIETIELEHSFKTDLILGVFHIILIMYWLNIIILLLVIVGLLCWWISSLLYFLQTGNSLKDEVVEKYISIRNKISSNWIKEDD